MKVADALNRLDKLWGPFGVRTEGMAYAGMLGEVEGYLHELAHAAAAGWTLLPASTSLKIADHARKMTPRGSDLQELRAVAIEVETAALMELPIRVGHVTRFAMKGLRTDRYLDDAAECRRLVQLYRARPSTMRHARRIVRFLDRRFP